MMKELWLVEDKSYVVFDTKESTQILGIDRLPSTTIAWLTEKEYKDYCRVVAEFYTWQLKLKEMIKSSDAVNTIGRYL